ncbi:MAG: translocase [Pseudomonadota bacterium]
MDITNLRTKGKAAMGKARGAMVNFRERSLDRYEALCDNAGGLQDRFASAVLSRRGALVAGSALTVALVTGFVIPRSNVEAAPLSQLQIAAPHNIIGDGKTPWAPLTRTDDAASMTPVAANSTIAPVISAVMTIEDDVALSIVPLADTCAPSLSATEGAGAMLLVTLDAPCHTEESVILHHEGMMFTVLTGASGQASVSVPALAVDATFMAEFDDGAMAITQVEVTSLPFFDRVVVQWTGDAGFQLHALEGGARFGETGHIWQASAGNISSAARGEGGFLTELGDTGVDMPRMAQVYTFPSGMAVEAQDVLLQVEAEITETNCGRDVNAQTLQLRPDTPLKIKDLSLAIPGCEAQGDLLVLADLVEDLVLATN